MLIYVPALFTLTSYAFHSCQHVCMCIPIPLTLPGGLNLPGRHGRKGTSLAAASRLEPVLVEADAVAVLLVGEDLDLAHDLVGTAARKNILNLAQKDPDDLPEERDEGGLVVFLVFGDVRRDVDEFLQADKNDLSRLGDWDFGIVQDTHELQDITKIVRRVIASNTDI